MQGQFIGRDDMSPNEASLFIYEYSVEGRQYSSDAISHAPFPLFYRTAQRVVGRHVPGGIVTIYYNPMNPRESVLMRGGIIKASILLFLTVVLASFFLRFVMGR